MKLSTQVLFSVPKIQKRTKGKIDQYSGVGERVERANGKGSKE